TPSRRARSSSPRASGSNGSCGELVKGTKRVALVGAALSDIGRVDTHTAYELHYQAASRAIADAGLAKDDVDGLGSSGLGLLTPTEIGEYLGLRPTWVDGTGVGGSTWEL